VLSAGIELQVRKKKDKSEEEGFREDVMNIIM